MSLLRVMPLQINGKLSGFSWQKFLLMGFEVGPEIQALLFALFLALYMVSVLENLTKIMVITLDAHFQSPMYFFLKNLTYLDLCYLPVIAPKSLTNVFSSTKNITFTGSATQFFFMSPFATYEAFLMTVMTYEYFMAICSPCATRSPGAPQPAPTYCGGCLNSIVQTSIMFHLLFYSSQNTDLFCDMPPLLLLACTNMAHNELVIFAFFGFIIVSTTHMFLVSYGYTTMTILRMRSMARRQELFSTCGSLMTVVTLFYGTLFVMYAQPGAVDSLEQGNVASIYTLAIPMLNPLIYSLRNKDVKEALQRLGQKHTAT